jgi:hypothetical protein
LLTLVRHGNVLTASDHCLGDHDGDRGFDNLDPEASMLPFRGRPALR